MKYSRLCTQVWIIILLTVNSLCIQKINAQFTINENFYTNNINQTIVLGGSASAYLTSGVIDPFTETLADPLNEGWLRLTNTQLNQKGFAYINSSFPSTLGVLIDFEFKSWRERLSAGDGFSVFLFDATVPFSVGGSGGNLGYRGLAGGYLGIGFDEYGNFSKNDGGPGQVPNAIVLRGPINNTVPNRYLIGKTLDDINSICYNTAVYSRPTDSEFYRRVKISIIPTGTISSPKYTITVSWRTSPNGNDITLMTYDTTDPIPSNLKLGFAASTGAAVNYHEIRNLVITTPGGVRIDKKVDKLNANIGDVLTYKVDIYNSTTATINNLALLDTLKSGDNNTLKSGIFEINSITFNNNGNIGNTVSGYTTGVPITTGFTNPFKISSLSMTANSVSTLTLVGTLKNTPIGGILKNTAFIDVSQTGMTDQDLTNNTSSAITNIPNTDFVIKTNFDDKCADIINGNTLTLLVTNIGSSSSDVNNVVTVKDTIPTGFTVMSTTNTSWTVSHAGNIYTFTRNDALASTSSYPPISIKIKPPKTGTQWENSATVSYAGIEASTFNNSSSDTLYLKPVAPTVTSPITYCNGLAATALTATGNNLLWYTSETGTGSSIAPVPNTTTSGNTTYYVSASNGICESTLTPIVVSVSKQTTASISGTTNISIDSVAMITFIGKDGIAPYTFIYNINGGANQTVVSTKGDTAIVQAVTSTAGVFTYNLVSVLDSKGCSSDQTGSAVVTITQLLKATMECASSICKDSIAYIIFTGKDGVTPYTFTYNINGDTNKTITTTNGDTVSIAVPTSTSGEFLCNIVNITDSKGNSTVSNSSAIYNIVDCALNIFIPNAFTPNADGYNDTFKPIIQGIEILNMSINDRNGRLVSLIDKIDEEWDGLMMSGEQAPVGVYFYKLDAKGFNKNLYVRQGSVSLFRDLVDNVPVEVSPNPVRENATVDLTNLMDGTKSISISNLSGKQIRAWNTSDDILELKLSNFEKGLYILKIAGNQQVRFVKFIKE